MLPQVQEDFAKRDRCLWLHATHNAHALARQFPRYTLTTFYRIGRGHQPKYMPDRIYLTFKAILEFAEHNRQEAYKLSFEHIAVKHKVSVETVRQLNRIWSRL